MRGTSREVEHLYFGKRDAEWLKPALGALKIFTPEYVASVIAEIIADDSKAGEYVALHNEPAGAS